MTVIKCFFLTPTNMVEQVLRRYSATPGNFCTESGFSYHDARVTIGRSPRHECPDTLISDDLWPHADPRWPKKCVCGYEFDPKDSWQYNPLLLFHRGDTNALTTLWGAPAGAMWDAHWLHNVKNCRVVDGIVLAVRTPGGDWVVDGPSYHGHRVHHEQGWTRQGTPPEITANPSILIPGKYHGWLRNGYLEEC